MNYICNFTNSLNIDINEPHTVLQKDKNSINYINEKHIRFYKEIIYIFISMNRSYELAKIFKHFNDT